MHLSTADLMERKKDGANVRLGEKKVSHEERMLAEITKLNANLGTLLAREQAAPVVNVAAPEVKVGAPNINVQVPKPEARPKTYTCKHVYDREGDLVQTVITVG